MVTDFMGELIAAMRGFAKLSQDELAGKIGVSTRTLDRMEKNDRETVIKHKVARKIVEATGVTKRRYADILAEIAGEHLGVRLVVLPPNTLVPSAHVMEALRLFSDYGYKLPKEERESIAGLLEDLRCHDAQAERLSSTIARDIIRRINTARIKLGEDPSTDSQV